jgi:hypothetical protein
VATGKRGLCTHLVLDRFLWELDLLLENAIYLLELDSLLPVIEGACNEDFLGEVLPIRKGQQATRSRAAAQRTT